jgi:phosphoribosyl 1,2-cyclic phosphodiesterase
MASSRVLHVHIVDDSHTQAEITRAVLEKAGHVVTVTHSSTAALRDIPARVPDCVLIDLMMPELDGYELCRRLRLLPALAGTKIVVVSSKAFPFERKRAAELGANGYFVKPVNPASFAADLERLVAGTLTLTFWGVRGTLPISRPDSQRYGGNTSCVSLDFPDGRLFVFDAGTGIKALSDALLASRRNRLDGRILISHPHWDHINALPFFAPFYAQGNQFEICGASHGDIGMRDLFSAQMDGVYFPVTVRELSASLSYRDLCEGEHEIGGVHVRTMLLSHPGNCLGYRIEVADRVVCYVTDNELYLPDSEFYSGEYVDRLADFVRAADVLITDCTYTDEEYPRKIGWGHSSVSQVTDLVARAEVKTLYLLHHDPDQSDAVVDAKLERAREQLGGRGAATAVFAPAERAQVEL